VAPPLMGRLVSGPPPPHTGDRTHTTVDAQGLSSSCAPLPTSPPDPRGLCTWRSFNTGNRTETHDWTYGLEVLFHEMLLQSEHR
jgi:hypothetical protein